MIGKLTTDGTDIILEDDSSIRCDDAQLKQLTEILFEQYQQDYSPSQGAFGYRFLYGLAEKLGGKVSIEKKKYKEDPNRVY